MLKPLSYCRECGCAILTEEDIGLIETDKDWIQPIDTAAFVPIKKRFVICRGCLDEHIRSEEIYLESMAECESAFERMAQIEAW